MKIRTPKSRFDLKIGRNDFVLDVGGGHNPHPRANVIIYRYLYNKAHRSGDHIHFSKIRDLLNNILRQS